MIHISLPLDNTYLELQEFLHIPYCRQTFMYRLRKRWQTRDQKNAFETMKCVKMYCYFKVFSIILMHYIAINFLLKNRIYMP